MFKRSSDVATDGFVRFFASDDGGFSSSKKDGVVQQGAGVFV